MTSPTPDPESEPVLVPVLSPPSRRTLLLGLIGGTLGGGTLGTAALRWRPPHSSPAGQETGRQLGIYGGDDANDSRANALQVWEKSPAIQNARLTTSYTKLSSNSTEQFDNIRNSLLTSKQTPDLIVIDPEFLPDLVQENLVTAFAGLTRNTLLGLGCFDRLADRCVVGGKVFGLPLNADSPVLVADTSLLSPSGKQRLTQLASVTNQKDFWIEAQSIATTSIGAPGTRKILLESAAYEGLTVCLVELIAAFGGDVAADVTLRGAANQTALRAIQQALPSAYFAENDQDMEDSVQAALRRHAAVFGRLWPSGAHDVLGLTAPAQEGSIAPYTMTPIPRGVLGGQVLAVPARSTSIAAAQELANYLSGALVQLQLFQNGDYVPTLRQLYTDTRVGADLSGVGVNLGTATLRPSLVHYAAWSETFREAVRAYLLGASDDILTTVTKPLQQALRDPT